MYVLCVCTHASVRVCVHTFTCLIIQTYMYICIFSHVLWAHVGGAEDNLKSVLSFYQASLVLRIRFRLPGLTAGTLTL